MKELFPVIAAVACVAVSVQAQDLEPLSTFSDCAGCPEMVVVPAGSFMMGSTDADARVPFIEFNNPAELPRHAVTIGQPFAIGRTEVTVEQFAQFVAETGTVTGGSCLIRLLESGPLALEYTGTPDPNAEPNDWGPYAVFIADGSFEQPGLPLVDRSQPATCISLAEIEAYLAWLSAKSGRDYRLPSEAEWEYAVRAGTETVAYWGDNLDQACRYANFADSGSVFQAGIVAPCSDAVQFDWSSPAGSYAPNPWGLYDMLGNVQEIVADCWNETHDGAPADGSPRLDGNCDWRVARGGDFELLFVSMRSAERLVYEVGKRANAAGFRVVASLGDGGGPTTTGGIDGEADAADVASLRQPPETPVERTSLDQPGTVFRDCDRCPEMVVIPEGSFTMGSRPTDVGRSDREGPLHAVHIRRFALGRFEVTSAEWRACVSAGGCAPTRSSDPYVAEMPAQFLDWHEAQDYLRWLSELTGYDYRLPSEAEWEYAARAGSSTAYWWGNAASHDYANYGKEECCGGSVFGADRWEYAAPVGSFPANGFGLHDMHGNVWEWIQDCWNETYEGAPADGSAWMSGVCPGRILRGGSWLFGSMSLRSGFRYWTDSSIILEYGFRVARTM